MARRRERPIARHDGELILPRELVAHIPYRSVDNAEALREQHKRRDAWMDAHGVDRRDWDRWHAVVFASERAHGVDHHWRLIDPDEPQARSNQ